MKRLTTSSDYLIPIFFVIGLVSKNGIFNLIKNVTVSLVSPC